MTDFLSKNQMDATLLERSIRYSINHHPALTELSESRERYELAVEGAHDGIWDWDIVADRIHLGRRWKEILGHGDEDIGDTSRGLARQQSIPTISTRSARWWTPISRVATEHFEIRAPHADRRRATTAGSSTAVSRSATATASRSGWPAACPTSPIASSPRSSFATTRSTTR